MIQTVCDECEKPIAGEVIEVIDILPGVWDVKQFHLACASKCVAIPHTERRIRRYEIQITS